jgi:sugar/nucleoside kinase (ribokinase family)
VTVLCAGILVADVFVPPLPRLPAAGELLDVPDFLVQPGGCAANAAIVLARLGVPVSIAGRVGDDPFGAAVVADLAARGIETGGVLRGAGIGTSKTVIIPVVGEDRRFIHTFGANAELRTDDLTIGAARIVYLGGYGVLPGIDQPALAGLFREARAKGARTVLDPVVPAGRDVSVAEVLPHTDVFLPNEDEARALSGETDPHEQAAVFAEQGARTVVIKLGERGAFVRTGAASFEVPAPPVDVVEPSGAGDAFAAGLMLGLLEGWELEHAVQFASVVGGSACTALGCWAGVFTRAEAEAFLAEHAA